MTKNQSKNGIKKLFGLLFFSPVIYSIALMDIGLAQAMFFYCSAFILFFVVIIRDQNLSDIPLNKVTGILFLIFPLTFITSFFNDSAFLLFLYLSDILIPFSIMLISLAMFLILGKEEFFKTVSFSIVIVTTLFSIIGLFEVYGVKIIPLPTIIGPGSTLGHRSFAAEFLLPALPFYVVIKDYIPKKYLPVLIFISIINITFLLFTRSRSAMILLAVAALIYFIFIIFTRPKGDGLKEILPAAAIIIFSFVISLQPTKSSERPEFEKTVESVFDTDYKSNVLRLRFWEASVEMISKNPITGIGLMRWSGSYPEYSGDYFNDENILYVQNIHSHNDFLEMAAESGLASAIFLILIIVIICLPLIKKIKTDPRYFYFLISFLLTIGFAFVSFPLHKFSSYFIAAIVAGTIIGANANSRGGTIRIKKNHFKIFLFCILIIGTVVSYIRLKSEIRFQEAIGAKNARQYLIMLEKLEEVSKIFYPYDPSMQPVDYYRALGNYYLHNLPQALKLNLSAKELSPFNPLILRNLAGAYQVNGDIAEAENIYEYMKQQFPNYIAPQVNLLYVYLGKKEIIKMEMLLSELVKKAPDNPRLIQFQKSLEIGNKQ